MSVLYGAVNRGKCSCVTVRSAAKGGQCGVKLKVLDKPSVEVKDEGVFFRVVKAAFSQRRKTLLNCLSANFPIPKDEISTLLESIGIAPSRRGETLSLEEFANIADTLLQKIK